ncbi:hypothetical protein DPMN_148391 [Dreissena polymorpha]|uniref:Uncharacterized protein n=1 Tax=Dreissena polymorpha TaxID=45954 RepID=A0A9D4J3Y3_DREPO|nr:hypothetical protein DPMN_148391 [Dreissena polymorpha]
MSKQQVKPSQQFRCKSYTDTGSSAEYPDQLVKNAKQYVTIPFWWNRQNMNPESFVSLHKLEDTHDRAFELFIESHKDTGLVSNTNAAIQSGKKQFEKRKLALAEGIFLIDANAKKQCSGKPLTLNQQRILKNDQLHVDSISREINPQLMNDEPQSMTGASSGDMIPQSMHHGRDIFNPIKIIIV